MSREINIDEIRKELSNAREAKDWNRYESICRDALAEISEDDFNSWYAFSLNLACVLLSNEDSNDWASDIEEAFEVFIIKYFKSFLFLKTKIHGHQSKVI